MRGLAFKIILIFLTFIKAGTAFSENAPPVKEITFQGLSRVSEAVVRTKATHETGEPLDYEKVSEDIKNLYALGHFEDVRVEAEPLEDGIRLIYILKEKPLIMRIDFQGNKEVASQKLKEEVKLIPGFALDIIVIQENADKIRALYESEGYPLVRVVPVIRKISDKSVMLTYQINEGDRVKIRKIRIKGNKEMSRRKIKKVMQTSSWWPLSFLTGSGKYERAKMSSDIEAIRDLYLDNGFINVSVLPPETRLSENKRKMDITVEVAEGDMYKVSAVGFSGNKVFPEAELKEKVKSSPGEAISKKTLNKDVVALVEMHTEKGYALATIYPDILPDEEKKEAKIIFRVREDDIYSIGRIEISGNIKTRDKVIRREVLLNEGDTFNGKHLKRSYQRINNLNLFEGVGLTPRPNPEKKTVDIAIEVKERLTGMVSVGGGYSSQDKFVGMLDITQGNLGGRAQSVKLKGEFGSRFSSYELSFREPWFFDKPVSFTTSVYKTRRELVNYEKKSDGFMFGFGWRFRDYWRTDLSYNFERTTIFNIEETASAAIREQAGAKITSSVSPSITRDSRDNVLDPHTGSKNALSLSYAGVGGDNKFFKAVAESSWFFPVSERTTLAFMGTYGMATGLQGVKLPLYERFYVGGIYTVRGLGYGDAGPRDERGAPTGGTKKVIFNAEYTFPLIAEASLKGVIFYDTGTAYDDRSSIRLRQTAGGGIRWISPIGPLRLEWGKNLDPQPGEGKGKWEFTFGTFF